MQTLNNKVVDDSCREYARNIIKDATGLVVSDGIFYTGRDVEVSYPKEGNLNSLELEDKSFWFKHRNNLIISMIKQYPPPLPVISDIGGGNGYVASGIQEAGFETIVIEPMYAGVINSKERGINNVICGVLEDVGFMPGSLPAIGLFDVLEHIKNDIDYLKSLRKYLASEGKIYLSVPAYKWLWSVYDDIAGHYHRYSLHSLKKVFEKAGYHCNFMTYFFSFLPLPIYLARTLPSQMNVLSRSKLNQARSRKEHIIGTGITKWIVDAICKMENRIIEKGKSIPFGGSCLIVATKK